MKAIISLCLVRRLHLLIGRYALIFLFLSLAQIANARLYQWVEPDTRITQLSGKPPPWYRSTEPGPRTFVFEHGKLIDDTGKTLSRNQSDELRRQAIISAPGDRKTNTTN